MEPSLDTPITTAPRTSTAAVDAAKKVAIVTGSSRGIGAGIARAYRQRGWAVVGNARASTPSDDVDTLTVDGDISQPATTERIIAAALERFGRIDTLINNAGLYVSKPFTEYTAADYASVVGVNVTGFFTLTQLAIAQMLKGGGGHVVNITTTLADYADSGVPAVLAALTKGGLAAATRSLAIEYAQRGIRVNAVSPGVIQTSMRHAAEYAALGPLQPIGRVGQVDDIVAGVMFLESSTFITGEIIHIDGGRIAGH
jgi:NAD(P)-dependent dehydrogenase (short-subunit alcohol dehydrogenase family)